LSSIFKNFKLRKMKVLVAVDGSDTAEKAFNCKYNNIDYYYTVLVFVNLKVDWESDQLSRFHVPFWLSQ